MLLATRFKKKEEQKIDILVNPLEYQYENYDLSITAPSMEQAKNIASLFIKTGLGDLLQGKKFSSLCYWTRCGIRL